MQVLFEDDKVIVFPSLRPAAHTHFIVLAKTLQLQSLTDLEDTPEHKALIGHMMVKAAQVAQNLNLGNGYRIVTNNGKNAH